MAAGIGEYVYEADKALFNWLQHTMVADWLGGSSVYLGNVYFWTPFFVFCGVLVIMANPKRGGWNVFFALGTVIVAYQASVLLSSFLRHPPPYYFAAMEGIRLPAFTVEATFSLPDWPMAAFFGLFAFLKGRLRRYRRPFPRILWLGPILFLFFRLLAGYAYPVDLLTSILIGFFMAFLMGKLAEGVDMLMEGEEPQQS